MTASLRDRLFLAGILLVAARMFTVGISWGLPSRLADPFLFGDRVPWTGRQIQALTQAGGERWDDPSRGADVAAGPGVSGQTNGSPLLRRGRPEVNLTDAQRAQIVRRYRLFSYQPDEMITFMSLARMRSAGDLDPRLYQYGGLWIYPVGGLLKAASLLHLVEARGGPDGLAFFLDHPEAFGRFYVVARLYAAAWGVIGVWAVYRLVMRLSATTGAAGGAVAAAVAAALFVMMPVVINMAHEAKPHLPGAVLVLISVLLAARYARSGRWRDAAGAGAACGAAFGMVLSALPVFSILPLMTLLRRDTWPRRLLVTLLAGATGAAVYAATNPYVLLHQFWRRDVFESNVNNSTAMYRVGRPAEGLLNEATLAADGMTVPLAVAGVVGAIALAVRAVRRRKDQSDVESGRRAAGLLLAAPALLIAVQFSLIGAGKPGEFGRFLLVPDVFLMIEAVVAIWTFFRPGGGRRTVAAGQAGDSAGDSLAGKRAVTRPALRPVALAGFVILICLLACTFRAGRLYAEGFVADSQPETSRLREAKLLRMMVLSGDARKLAVASDPAPYCLPPVDLFRWQIIKEPELAPPGGVKPTDADEEDGSGEAGSATAPDVGADVVVVPVDRPSAESALLTTPISWAAKPLQVRTAGARQGRGPVPPPAGP